MSTSPFTLDDLLAAEGQDVVRSRLLANLAADGQPVSSWAPSSAGGVENLMVDMISGGIAFFMAERVAASVAGRHAAIAADSPDTGFWQTYLGRTFYRLAKQRATYTVQNVRLFSTPDTGTNVFADGDLWVRAPATGNNYRLYLPPDETIELPPGNYVDASFIAENPGKRYADPAGTVTQLVTPKAGVTCSNVRPYDFFPTRVAGRSNGTVVGSFSSVTGVADVVGYAAARARIDTDGNIGTATWSSSTDGGRTWTRRGFVPTVFHLPEGGYLFFSNGTSPSFRTGTIFTLLVADAILQRGADDETRAAFYRRMQCRWPGLSLVPTKGAVELWAHEASPEIARVASAADPNTPGGVLVTVASATGPASPAAQAAVEDFVRARLGFKGVPAPTSPTVAGSQSPEETVLVTSARKFQVRAAGTAYVPAEALQAAQAGADDAWDAYLADVPLGGDPDALVKREALFTILGDLGVEDVQDLELNGSAADARVPAGYVAERADGASLLADIRWVPT